MMAAACGMFSFSGASFSIGGRFLGRARLLLDPADASDVALFGMMNFFHQMLVGDWSAEHELSEEAIEQALQVGSLWDVTNYLGLYGKRCAHQGKFDEAERVIIRLQTIADDYDFGNARQNQGAVSTFLHFERGSLQDARRAAADYTTTIDEDPPRIFALGLDARILARMGDLESAHSRVERAEALAAQVGIIPPFQMSTVQVARLVLDVGQLEQACADGGGPAARRLGRRALRSGKRAVRMAAKVASKRVETYQLMGNCHWLLGRRGAAFSWWHRSIEAGESLAAAPQLARTYLDISDRLLTARDQSLFLGESAESLQRKGSAILTGLNNREQFHGVNRRAGTSVDS
jgi:hypothetical protein